MIYGPIHDTLLGLSDPQYRAFQCKLIPNVNPDTILGIRLPILRRLAKAFCMESSSDDFMEELPHFYLEENMLHALLINECKDYDEAMRFLQNFLPTLDNWATTDSLRPKAFTSAKVKPRLERDIRILMADEHPFIKRFAIEMLMTYFLDSDFRIEHLHWVASQRMDNYYVKMMVAWYFATALAKQYESTVPLFEVPVLLPWTHNKSIQKAIESYRVTPEHKDYLRTLRLK